MNTGNPALRTFENLGTRVGAVAQTDRMTIQGTVWKSLFLLLVVGAGAFWANLNFLPPLPAEGQPFDIRSILNGWILYGIPIGGLVLYFVTVWKPNLAPYTAPLYAGIKGIFLATISWIFEAFFYRGIAFQAVVGTFGVFFTMLILYQSGIIRATPLVKRMVFVGLGALFFLYILQMILGFFGLTPFSALHDSGPIGIGFSVVVIGLAAFTLIVDFDHIETGAREGAPKVGEWFGAFVLLVTLLWIYLEILKLLAKLNRRN